MLAEGRLLAARGWYEETGNPLYAWEAIALCLNADPPVDVPDWCIAPLRDAATNLCSLAWGRNFQDTSKKISPERATELVSAALSLSKQGKRNSFASVVIDRDAQKDALDLAYASGGLRPLLLEQIKKKRNVTEDRVGRIISRGKRLNGFTSGETS